MPIAEKAPQKLKNSVHAKRELENFIIPHDYALVSFDVKSLFTSIPIALATDSIGAAINADEQWQERTSLTKDDAIALVELCMTSNFFQQNNQVYRQVNGTPMGSPISVVAAELTMQEIERKIFEQAPCDIKLWRRFVDDTIVVIPKNSVGQFQDFINSINSNIQFTSEIEQDGTLNFLDISITRLESGSITFKVYRKPTNTNRYLDCDSCHSKKQKEGVIRSLSDRAHRICSANQVDQELNQVREQLKLNGYTNSTINKVFNTSKIYNQQQVEEPIRESVDRIANQQYCSAPYIPGASERISRIFKQNGVIISHKPCNTIESKLCQLKDKRNVMALSNVVYELRCKDCDVVYIGETGRQVGQRIREHENAIARNCHLSKINQHIRSTGHSFNFCDVKILARETNHQKRLYLEAYYSVNQHSINRKVDISEQL